MCRQTHRSSGWSSAPCKYMRMLRGPRIVDRGLGLARLAAKRLSAPAPVPAAVTSHCRCYARRAPGANDTTDTKDTAPAFIATEEQNHASDSAAPRHFPMAGGRKSSRTDRYAPYFKALDEIAADPHAFKDLQSLLAAVEGRPPAKSLQTESSSQKQNEEDLEHAGSRKERRTPRETVAVENMAKSEEESDGAETDQSENTTRNRRRARLAERRKSLQRSLAELPSVAMETMADNDDRDASPRYDPLAEPVETDTQRQIYREGASSERGHTERETGAEEEEGSDEGEGEKEEGKRRQGQPRRKKFDALDKWLSSGDLDDSNAGGANEEVRSTDVFGNPLHPTREEEEDVMMAVKKFKQGKYPGLELMLASSPITAYGGLDEKSKRTVAQFYRQQIELQKRQKVLKAPEFSLGESDVLTVEGKRKKDMTPKRQSRVATKIFKAVQSVILRGEKTNPVLGHLNVEISRVEMSADNKYAEIFWKNLGMYSEAEVSRVLAKQQKLLRWEVQRVVNMRHAPMLVFRPDHQHSARSQVEELIDRVQEEKKSPRHAGDGRAAS